MRTSIIKCILFSITILSVNTTDVFGQLDLPPEDIDGQTLRTWLKQNWYDGHENISSSSSSGYRAARLEMYNKIDVVDNKLEGFYSGYIVNVPSQGFDAPADISPMDCEHIVPQSLFSSNAPMKNDIFHLRPTYSNWNSTRGNLPFDENNDLSTDKWMRFDDKISCSGDPSCVPNVSIIDEFSEVINSQSWEPREIVKGDVARAVFYFFTVYTQFDIESVGDIEQLYEWHLQDPADENELNRNDMVEDYQGNRNPYIDHADWVQRAWLPNYEPPIPSGTGINIENSIIEVYPVPTVDFLNLSFNSVPKNLSYEIFDVSGVAVKNAYSYNELKGNLFSINVSSLPSGIYFAVLQSDELKVGAIKFIKQ